MGDLGQKIFPKFLEEDKESEILDRRSILKFCKECSRLIKEKVKNHHKKHLDFLNNE
jgi:hypothetical protein